MLKIFKKKPNKFIAMMIEQAALTYKGVELLQEYLETHDHALAKKLTMTEKEADEVRRILIDELNRTFVTLPYGLKSITACCRLSGMLFGP